MNSKDLNSVLSNAIVNLNDAEFLSNLQDFGVVLNLALEKVIRLEVQLKLRESALVQLY